MNQPNNYDTRSSPFTLSLPQESSATLQLLFRILKNPLEKITRLSALDAEYKKIKTSPDEFFPSAVLRHMDIKYEISGGSLERIPTTGPVIVVANHPFGGIEGLILLELLRTVRSDARVLANFLLGRVPEIAENFILVDPFERSSATKSNITPLKVAIDWIKKGHLLGIFPSGTVSHLHLRQREITDPEWSVTVPRLVRKTKATVVPLYFEGANGPLFQLAGLIHPLLRTAMLPSELWNKQHCTLRLKLGTPIPYEKLHSRGSDEQMLAYLRLRTYILSNQKNTTRSRIWTSQYFPVLRSSVAEQEPLAAPEDPELMRQEVSALPAQQLLLASNNLRVYVARARQIPHVLQEIGRLREVAFRGASEGTGKSSDLDRFDKYYRHLFLWNEDTAEVVGAYRLVHADRVFRRYGVEGLYTHSLFAYSERLLEEMGPSIELGRSFIRPEYQKNFSTLLLLWRGIGQYVARNPRYKALFGPVSINAEYDSVSRKLITMFLEANNFLPELAKFIRPRNPARKVRVRGLDAQTTSFIVRDLESVSELLAEMESKQKSVPVLLRQYLKLGGKLLSFNVDEDFGDVLDGLIYVDLTQTEPRLRERYLGKEGSDILVQYHSSVHP